MATAAAAKDDQPAHRFAKDQLKAFVERVERLEEEKKALSDDIRDVYAEAKGNGFDVKTLRVVVRLRKQDIWMRGWAAPWGLRRSEIRVRVPRGPQQPGVCARASSG